MGSNMGIMSCNDEGLTSASAQVSDQIEDIFTIPCIQITSWFIGDHNCGSVARDLAIATRCCSPPES